MTPSDYDDEHEEAASQPRELVIDATKLLDDLTYAIAEAYRQHIRDLAREDRPRDIVEAGESKATKYVSRKRQS